MHVARIVALAVALTASVGAALAHATRGTRGPRGPRQHEVVMRSNSFAPRSLTVSVGDTVVWINRDIVRHNAVRDSLFDSGELRGGEQYAWVPGDTGEVAYRCTIHSRMRGTIRVLSKP